MVAQTGTFHGVAIAADTGTIALADQLVHLRERIELGEQDIAKATGADAQTVSAWLSRQAAPAGPSPFRLSELITV